MTKGERTYAGTKGPKNFQEAQALAGQEKDNPAIYPDYYFVNTPYEIFKVLKAWKLLDYFLASAIVYIVRAGKKSGNSELQDLKKARRYLDDRIKDLENVKL